MCYVAVQLELLMSAGTFALAFVAVVSGIFGMNLRNDEELDPNTFVLVRGNGSVSRFENVI